MAKGKAHSAETKSAVIAALLAGQGVNEVATAFGLSKSVISRIKNEIAPAQLEQVGTQKKERLVDLVESHLTESLKAATAIARQTQDDLWRSKQSAENLAIFYGVLSDKSIRLLEIGGRIFADQQQAA